MIGNRFGLPDAYARAITETQRTPQPRTISVTELLKPPRLRALEVAHAEELESDVADYLPQFFGSAVHAYLERFGGGTFREHRLHVEVDGWTVTGQPDAIDWYGRDGGTLCDWKTTTVRAAGYEKREWEEQTNLYAHLGRLAGLPPVTEIVIWAYLRDWDRGAMARDGAYPRAGIIRRDIPLWPEAKADGFLRTRLALHRGALEDGVLPDCTPEDRWVRDKWTVTKVGNARATRLFDSELEAYAWARSQLDPVQRVEDWYDIARRPGRPLRCESWCPVSGVCGQWQAEREAMTLAELVETE